MDKWSTLNISMNLFTTVSELFREFKFPATFEAGIPYDLIKVDDAVSKMDAGGPLPSGFKENRYYVLNGNTREVSIDAAWHENDGLVNFSFLLEPKAFFKKRLMNDIFNNYVVPYVEKNCGSKNWKEFTLGQKYLIDTNRSIVYAAKFYFDNPVSFGLSVIDLKYSGI